MNPVGPMRYLTHLAIASTFVLCFAPERGIAQGRDWAFDFKMTDSGTASGQGFSGVTAGHAVVSKGRIRLDMKGNSRNLSMPGMAGGAEVSMIVQDSGRVVTYIMPTKKEYMEFKPAELMKEMRRMFEGLGTAVNFTFSGPDPKVENLGKGPAILGHPTVHYRTTVVIKLTMGMMGESQSTEMSTVSDQYFATDLAEVMDPFSGMTAMGQVTGMFGAANKSYLDKMDAMKSTLPKAPELRAESKMSTTGPAGQQNKISSVREITKIERVTASPDLFTVPAGYKKLEMPMGKSVPATKK
jgi:hypothetical protein